MKEAGFYNGAGDGRVRCQLRPQNCLIAPGRRGLCGVRENRDGRLISLVNGRPAAQAAVLCCRNRGARRVTVAAPVASPEAYAALQESADELAVLLTPRFFRAVAEFYQRWYDVPDGEVVKIMERATEERLLATTRYPHTNVASGAGKNIAPGGRGSGLPCIR